MPATGRATEATYYELSLLADGVESGAAKAKSALHQVEQQADKTAAAVDRVGSSGGTGNRQAFQEKAVAIAELNAQFKSGAISQDAYEKAALSLGVKIKTLSEAGRAAAAAFVAEGTAAAGAAVGIEAADVATKGLLATFLPFAVAAIGVELGVRLIRSAWDKLTEGAREAKRATDELIDSLLKQRAAERPETVKAQEKLNQSNDVVARAQAALNRAQRGTPILDRAIGEDATIVDPKKVADAQRELTIATNAQETAQRAYNKALGETDEAHARRLAGLVAEGVASQKNIADLAQLGASARSELKLLASASEAGTAARKKILDEALDDPTAIEKRRAQLAEIVKAADEADKKATKLGESAASAAERLRAAQDSARQAFGSATAAQTPGQGDNFDEQITKLTAQAVKAKLSADEIRKLVSDLRAAHAESLKQEAQSLNDDLRSQLVATTKTQVDDLVLALEKLDEKIAKSRLNGTLTPENEGLAAQLRAAKVETIELTKQSEALGRALDHIHEVTAENRDFIQSMRTLSGELSKVTVARDAAPEGSDARVRANERIKQLTAEIAELQKKLNVYLGHADVTTADIESKTQRLASGLAAVANIAYGLASAFSGANDEVTKMIGGIAQAAGGVSSLLAAAHKKDANGDAVGLVGALGTVAGLGALGQVIGGGIALASALFGQSPEEKARIQRTKDNTDALIKLTDRVGDLGKINVTGSDVGRTQAAINTILANPDSRNIFAGQKPFLDGLKSVGLTASDFVEIAKQFGIVVDKTKITFDDILLVQQAIKAAEITQFGDSFAGQMQELDAAVKLFPDLKTPTAQFDAFRKALEKIKDGGGVLSKVLKDFDLSTSEGIAAAQEAIQGLFKKLEDGSLTAADLGGLTPQEFLDALLKTQAFIDAQKGATGTGGFNTVQTITEVTGARMGALLSTANIFAQQISENTAGILRQLGGAVNPGPISPPSISSSNSFSGSPLSVTLDINITVTGSVSDTQAQATGQKIGEATIRAIDKGLGNRALWARRAAGNVVRS